jgi:hypothetical protein
VRLHSHGWESTARDRRSRLAYSERIVGKPLAKTMSRERRTSRRGRIAMEAYVMLMVGLLIFIGSIAGIVTLLDHTVDS